MEVSDASYQVIADILHARTGQQLTPSRRWRIRTALAGLFRERGIDNVDQLACLLAMPGDAALERDVVEALLNNETYFFRDRPTFEQIPAQVLPDLAQRRAGSRRLRIWSAGCSTGQEVHTLAIQFAEQAAQWDGWTIEILGTDISQKAIAAAGSRIYSQFEVQRGLSVMQMISHFDETQGGWRFSGNTPVSIEFRQHNVLDPAPAPGRFDLVLCRNVLLYFAPETRALAFNRLRSAVASDGYLMLGAGETVVGQTDAFRPLPGMNSLYQPSASSAEQPLRLAG